ncbi:MAG: hypothetical protein WCJ64_03415 [Rhodospirillaceae bacterium]
MDAKMMMLALEEIAQLERSTEPSETEPDSHAEIERRGFRRGLRHAAKIARHALTFDREILGVTEIGSAAYSVLNEDEKAHLHNLNSTITEIEMIYHPIAVALNIQLEKRRLDRTDLLHDFSIQLNIELFPSGDIDFQDSDSIWEISQPLNNERDPPPDFGFGAVDTNHAEPGKLQEEPQCYLYHQLRDHTGLKLQDLLRVGLVWVDLVVTYQSVHPVTGPGCAVATITP